MSRTLNRRMKRWRLRQRRRRTQEANIYWHWLMREIGDDGRKKLGIMLQADRMIDELGLERKLA